MAWTLRYAPHLGYLPSDRTPLFSSLAGSCPCDQIRFVASQSMAGILDPWAADRTDAQRRAIKETLGAEGLKCGCVVGTPLARLREPLWVADSVEPELLDLVSSALTVAVELGSTTIAVLLFADGTASRAIQRKRAIARLYKAANIVATQGVTLLVEPMKASGQMLLGSFADGVDLIREIAHPNVKLIFDTGHVEEMGEPLLETYIEAYEEIGVLQLADMPGRIEVGSGMIDFVSLLTHACEQGYTGLVELEHGWSRSDAETAQRGIEALRAVDNRVSANVALRRELQALDTRG